MSKIIVITSGKGGVGKTTTAINLGAAINLFGKDVVVIDANISTPNVGLHLNSPEVPVNLNSVLNGKSDIFEAVYEHDSGLKVIPSSLSVSELKKFNPNKIKDFREDFLKVSDYVIIDSAAGLGEEVLSVIDLADEIIIVTNPEMPAITDALKTIKVAEQRKKLVKGVIMTRVKKNKVEMQSNIVKEMLELPILGMIPEDICISNALNSKDAVIHVFPKSRSSRAYKEIASKIVDVEYNSKKDRPKLWEIIFRRKNY